MKIIKYIPAVALSLAIGSQAVAADYGDGYLKLALGQTKADISQSDEDSLNDGSLTSTSIDDEDTSLAIGLGFYLSENLSIALSHVDLGEAEFNATSDGSGFFYAAGPVSITDEIDGIALGLNLHLPINKTWEVVATVGQYWWDSEATLRDGDGTFGGDDSGNDPFLGIAANYHIRPNFSVGAGFTRYDIDGTDVDVIAASLQYRFGKSVDREMRQERMSQSVKKAPASSSRPSPQSVQQQAAPSKPITKKGNMTRAAEQYERERGQ